MVQAFPLKHPQLLAVAASSTSAFYSCSLFLRYREFQQKEKRGV
jgi:hypothetical protein